MISLQEFTSRIKQKYPQYQQVGDSELAQRMLEKYPQYADQINPQEIQKLGQSIATRQVTSQPLGPYGAVGVGAGKGALSTISGMAELGQKGLQAATGIKPQLSGTGPFAVEGGVAGLRPELTTPKGTAESIGYGAEQIAEFLMPASKVSQVTKPLTAAKGIPTMIGKFARVAAPAVAEAGTVAGVAGLQEGQLPQASDFVTALALGGIIRGGAKAIEKIGKGIYGMALPMTQTQKAIMKQRKIDLPKELIREIGGMKNRAQFIKSTQNQISKYRSQADDIIKQAQKTNEAARKIDSKALFTEARKNLDDILAQAPESDAPRIMKAANAEMAAALKKVGKKPLTLSKVNEFKRFFDKKINYDKLDPIATAKNAIDKSIADSARGVIQKLSPEVTALNAKIGPLAEAAKLLTKKGEYSGYLTDVIAAAQAGSLRGAIGNIFLKRIATAFPTKTTLGAGLYKAGQALGAPSGIRTLQAGAARTF